MSYHNTPKRQRVARSTIGQYVYDGVRRMGAAAVGGFMHKAAGGARNLGRDFAGAATGFIQDATHAATTQMRQAAARAAANMSGGSAMNIGENSVVPAQLIPGRGAELSFQQMNILNPIKFKTGESSGGPLVSAFGQEEKLFKGQTAMHAFAFKMQLVAPSFISTSESVPVSRFVVHNVFRHYLAGVNNTSSGNRPYGTNQVTWNQTLGPDKSLVRQLGSNAFGQTGAGSAITVTAGTGLDATLQSPFRYPSNGTFMFSRMTRQLMENLGWNANPLKIAYLAEGSVLPPTLVGLPCYSSAPSYTQDAINSAPHLVPRSPDGVNYGPSVFYKSQFGKGQVSYTFNNDGTNPVVVEIVITRLKKNELLLKGDLAGMVQIYQDGYMQYALANRNQAQLSGQPPALVDVTTNARGPFLPAKALTQQKRQGVANDSSAPFKQVARDQFILSGGSSRNWCTSLQAFSYDARTVPQFQATVPAAGVDLTGYDNTSNCCDQYTYIFSIATSGVPAPYVEFAGGDGNVASVIDRRGTDCSVSVTGAYKEVCAPVYVSQVNSDTYIGGRLDVPHFGVDATPSLTTNDIANIGQATRGASTSSVLIGMGPLNTVGGG